MDASPSRCAEHIARVGFEAPALPYLASLRSAMRLIEVKCRLSDGPTLKQPTFLSTAESLGISIKVVEWEFRVRVDAFF